MSRTWIVIAGLNGFLAVAAGAFGAHGLKSRIGSEALVIFETAARYHMYHALALLVLGWGDARLRTTIASASGWCFLAGIIVFCGTLYALALGNMRWRWLGAITPIGGTAFLAGWVLLVLAALRGRQSL